MSINILRNRSVAVKFFLVFFLTSAVAVSLMMTIVYYTVEGHLLDSRVTRLGIIHKIKAKQLQNAISHVQNPLLKFLKNNTEEYGFYKVVDAYNNLPNDVSSATVEACRQELSKYHTQEFNDKLIFEYLKITPNDAVPIGSSGILAQCIDLMGKVDIGYIEGIGDNVPSVKEYMDISEYFSNAFSLLLDEVGLEDVLFVSADDDIVYTPSKSSVLGHNLISSYWIKGLANQVAKFHSMSSDDGNMSFFVDMQPYMALGGYPVFFVMSPVFKDNKYSGCIVLVLSSLFIDAILSDNSNWQSEGLGLTGDAYVTALDGVFRSNRRDLVERTDDYVALLAKSGASPIVCKLVEQFGTVAYYSSILGKPPVSAFDGKSGNGSYKSADGKDIIMYYAPLHLGEFNWVLYIHAESGEIINEIASVRVLILKLLLPIMLLILLITIAFAYFITRPIRQLTKRCIAIAKGEASSIDIQDSYREINDLMKSFDEMVLTLIANQNQTEEVKRTLEDSLLNQAVIAQALKEEKDFVTRILDAKGFYMLVVDSDNKIVRINNAIKILDFAEDIVGKKYSEFIPDKYKSEVASILSIIRSGNDQVPHLITNIENNNKSMYIEWNFSVFSGRDFDDGHIAQFTIVIGVDVTERYEAEKNSKENAAMFHMIFSNAYDAILIADENNHILLVNRSFEKLFNFEYMDLIDKPVLGNVIPNEYRNVILSDTQEGKSIEIEAIRSDLSTFPVDISISRIVYHGKLSMLYILRDSSLRKRKEKELQVSLKQAREAERIKSEFLANVSYEMHTQLNGIMGFVELLKETGLSDVQKEYLKIINSSSGSLFNIVNDVLDYTKIENGKMQLDVIEFNAWSLFEDSVKLFASKAMSKSILLMCMYSVDMPRYFLGDPLRIRQIMSNLISNAVKFTGVGGRVIVRAMLVSRNSETCKIRISIKDSGIGITKEQQKRIMDTFNQPGVVVNHHGGSSGLGLAISKSLAHFMNSSLSVYSELGEGSEFYFTLELPIADKKDIQARVDFSDVTVVLLGNNPDSPIRGFYEEYIKSVKAHVYYTSNIDDIRSEDVKIVGLNYDSGDVNFIIDIVNKFPDKSFIVFSNTSVDEKIYDIDNKNVYQLVAPLNISKLITILSDILGYQKTSFSKSSKQKKVSFSGRVLLVDDNEVNRKLAEIHLKNVGLEVELAENGQEAVDMYKQSVYDLMFMDVYMPIKDGLTATREIIEYEKSMGLRHVPIVALTANVDEHDIEECINSGMDDFVAKPIVKNKIEAILLRYLDKEQAVFSKTLIKNVAESINSDDFELISATVDEYYQIAWRYVQNLFYAVGEYNERTSLYLIGKIYGLSEKYRLSFVANVLDKIKQNIESGMNEDIFILIDELKDTIHKIRYSVRMFK